MPLVAAAAIGGGTSLISGILGANAAGNAANAQANAAENAAMVSRQNALDSLNFQKQQYNNSLQMLNPYLQTGYGALGMLRQGMGIGGPMPQGFTMPTGTNGPTNNLSDLRNILSGGGAFDNNPVLNRAGGGGPVPMQAMSNLVPATGLASATSGTVPQFAGGINSVGGAGGPISGGTFQFPSGEAGTPGGSVNTGTSGTPLSGGGAMVPATNGGTDSGNASLGFGSLLSPFTEQFKAPTVTDDPGYQFRLKQGMDALQNSAAARGGLLSGGTAKAMSDYAQGSASQEYGNAYNRALSEYLNRYNIFTGNQTNQFNKLADLSGMGQTAGNQLSTAGLTTANQVGNTLLGSAGQIGNDLQNAGAARGSGYVGGANAIGGALGNMGNLAMLAALLKNGGGSSGSSGGMGVV